MVALYVTSSETAGKTALCASIGKRLIEEGVRVGFFMPVQLLEAGSVNGNGDISFIRETLKLSESTEQLCHLRLSRQRLWQVLTDEVVDFTQSLKQAYYRVSGGKDVVMMEGLSMVGVDKVSMLACYTIAEALEASVIIVLSYPSALAPSKIIQVGEKLGRRLLGIVINFVPQRRMEMARQELLGPFQRAGIKVLGILPEVRSLLGITVKELIEILGGEILACPERTDEIVENVMLGAMTVDSGIDYFNRKANKVVVVRGERADMQLAALQTSTKCLVLTRNSKPLQAVISLAEERNIPLVVVKQDTFAAIAGIERALAKPNFRNSRKLLTFEKLLASHFDFRTFCLELGLKS